MKALLIVAHGSRREASNEEVRRLCKQVQEKAAETLGMVRPGFLELAEPSIPAGIQACIEEGAQQVTVLPYFLSAGRHVSEDIPAEVNRARAQNPHVNIILAPYLGAAPEIIDLLIKSGG